MKRLRRVDRTHAGQGAGSHHWPVDAGVLRVVLECLRG